MATSSGGTWTNKDCECDFCRLEAGISREARFDAKTNRGPWANMCYPHWTQNSQRILGTGYGQMLVRQGEDAAPACEWPSR